ncbi:MAG: hypothetical protein MUE75_01645, partial [Algoriphagus sp.]|nr:hypothetical protein [Algoriphagus sp.]
LVLYRQLNQVHARPVSLSLGDLILDKINELGPEKFIFRTRLSSNVTFDRELIDFLLQEVFDNALSFSMPKCAVEIEFFGNELTVKNRQGHHPPGHQIPVTPFSKVGNDGSFERLGLGLFLMDAYCQKNEAKLSLEVNNVGEFVVKVSFRNT